MITIVLADDEALLRKALAALLPMEAEIEVVAEAATGREAITTTLRHTPDVLVIDLEMPDLDGLAAIDIIRAQRPDQTVLMLTRHARPGVLRKVLKLGVRGFVSKSADPAHIAAVIQAVHAGQRWVDPEISTQALIEDCPLTERELDVLRITGEGYSVRAIATTLHLSEGTVRNYLSNAIQKTHTSTRHDAARYARERDWL